jgi:hypothetical protein
VLSTFLVTNLHDAGAGSLRDAILHVNQDTANPGVDTINFNLSGAGPYTIKLKSELPAITHSVFLNGGSQPGYAGTPLVQLDGSGLFGSRDGLAINAAGHGASFSAEVMGLALLHFTDGIQVSDEQSSTALGVNLHDNKIVAHDGIQVVMGTTSNTVQIVHNQITVYGGDAIGLVTAGTSNTVTVSGNTIRVYGGGDGIHTEGAGSAASLSYDKNDVELHGSGDALVIEVSSSTSVDASVTNDRLSTDDKGTGLHLVGGSKFQARVEGNDFHDDKVGVQVEGDGSTAGTIDLGGGSLDSKGGNDFRSFGPATADSYAVGVFGVAAADRVSAKDDLFSGDPSREVADGTHDPEAGGSGEVST